ncbi:hypothetical protein Bca52824_065746 [Brassica carinata]|uniref:JmjC domain-containing protein n=1 Tax=Brassica carinata TaxID=52824 RepID=A0A8X7UCP8_BRACI|nr:hypothetical protein Bca52824_065746 [Brassica carinata]
MLAWRQQSPATRARRRRRVMAWGSFTPVPGTPLPVWRDAYSMACLHVAKFHFAAGEFGEPSVRSTWVSSWEDASPGPTRLCRFSLLEARKKGKSGLEASGDFKGEKLVPEAPVDVNEVLKILPLRSLTCGRVEKGTPVVITNCMAHWPARTKWNHLDYLTSVAGNRTVPVEVGKNYLCSDWKQELVTFSKFLERIRTNTSTPVEPTYLAQHPLDDICIPDYCFVGGGELQSLNAWFGPAGTVTPLHHDPHHNILAQVVGKKYVRLYPSSLQGELYPYSETMLCNSSQILKVSREENICSETEHEDVCFV